MFKKSLIAQSVLLAMAVPALALAETTMKVELKNETAVLTKDGQFTGQAQTSQDTTTNNSKGDLVKFENSAKIFLNGDIGESSSWHGEVKIVYDSEAISDDNRDWSWRGHENYSQQDFLIELYIDTEANGWFMRIGKQQQVWGTADGIKLLDIINPTDYREWAQGDIEESRIPVWMFTAEKNFDNGGNFQVIVAEARPNVVAGLNSIEDNETRSIQLTWPPVAPSVTTTNAAGVDSGHLFLMKGVDTISGPVNGFFNIGAAFGPVTDFFNRGGFTDPNGGNVAAGYNSQAEGFTVGAFTSIGAGGAAAFGCGGADGALCLETYTETVNGQKTNLIDVTTVDNINGLGWDTQNPNSMWEYMPNATFATFNAFVGMSTKYERDYENDIDGNFGARFRNSTADGLNWGVNYLYAYDPNPIVNVHWEDQQGNKLIYNEYTANLGGGNTATVGQLSNQAGTIFYGANDVNYTNGTAGDAGDLYGGNGPTDVVNGVNNATTGPVLVFEEKRERIHNIGASFDYASSLSDTPMVLRGEFLYQKDVHQPVVDLDALARGNLTSALKTQEHDFFKYVLGADFTVMTNLLVSGQFIQQINLDYIDGTRRYTADPSTMHLSNGLQKGWEYKEFYSLFLSKPIGEEQLGRWNNITMYEDGGGWWNRLNADYSISDNFIVTGAWNNYWGDEDTTFGQFKDSSSVEVGFKYIFDEY
jgi:hypothetical protein